MGKQIIGFWINLKGKMGINNKLTIFAARELVMAREASERDRIELSIQRLKNKLRYKLFRDIKAFILFGSYTRNTILPRKYDPNSDIDLLVVFNTTDSIKTPETYRKYLVNVLDEAYPNSLSEKDFPAVKLVLNHIKFDIVPAYVSKYNMIAGNSYYIPDSGNNWRSTIPNDLNQYLSSKNQSYGNNVIRNTIRLCKHWNAFAGYPFESYLMESQIVDLSYWSDKNTYERFLNTLNSIAGNLPGVRQALEYIEKYKDDWFNKPNEDKQFEWLQKLLPGLK